MFQVSPVLSKPRAIGVVLKFAEHASFGDRIVWTQSDRSSQPALQNIHAIPDYKQQPMRQSSFAVRVSPPSDSARYSLQRLCGAEDRCQELMFRRFLPRIPLRLPLREVPVSSRRLGFLLRVRGPVIRIEVHAPSRYSSPQFFRLWFNSWFFSRVCHTSSYAAAGTTSGLMTPSSLFDIR